MTDVSQEKITPRTLAIGIRPGSKVVVLRHEVIQGKGRGAVGDYSKILFVTDGISETLLLSYLIINCTLNSGLMFNKDIVRHLIEYT